VLLQENARSMTRFVQDNKLNYNIVKNVDTDLNLTQNNIFVFTPERVLQLIATHPNIKIDFFFFDEIYKIDEDYCSDSIDEKHEEIQANQSEDFLNANRGKTFRIALYLLSKRVPEYYLAGPNLNKDKFGLGMLRFLKSNNISVKEINFEPTLRITVEAHSRKIVENAPVCLPQTTSTVVAKLDSHVNDKIRCVVNYIGEQNYGKTLLYCTTPGKAIEYASKLAEAHMDNEPVRYSADFEEFIEHIRHELKFDALKRQGARSDLTSEQVAPKLSTEIIAEQENTSKDTIKRYIRMTKLIKPLLDLVDEGKIALTPAEKLSYLKEEEQRALAELIQDYEATPSLSQAVKLKEMSAMQMLDADMMFEVMSRPKPNQKETLKLDLESLRTFFPDSTPKDMESAILRILTEWQKREQSKVQSRNSWDRDGR